MGDTPEGTEPTTTEPAADQETQVNWQEEAEKWKGLARKHEARAKENADAAKRVREYDDANKTAEEKAVEATQRAAAAEAKALRYEVAADKALPKDAMEFLTGSSREELETNADRLMQLMKAKADAPAGADKPKEKLRPGSNPDGNKTDEESVEEIVKRLPR